MQSPSVQPVESNSGADEELESEDSCVSACNNITTTNYAATPVPNFWMPSVARLATKMDFGPLRLHVALRLKQKRGLSLSFVAMVVDLTKMLLVCSSIM